MRLIIDNNILFSLMKPDSTNSKLFYLMKAEFVAPEFIKEEFNKYKKECLIKSKLSEQEFKLREKEVFDKIELIKLKSYKELIKEAKKLIKDADDSPYIALALKINAPIWSNDKGLKEQDKVKILSTEDLIMTLF